jgi:4-amino-4-deoxy-L-arabinose transferase-like glycosyltransferase
MTLDDRRARRVIVAIAALGCVARLLFGLLYWVDKPLTHDEREYLALAGSIASGAGFVYDETLETGTAQRFGRAPGYPLFLATLDAGRPMPVATPARVKIAQSAIGGAIVSLIGLLACASAGPRAGVVAAGLAALYPPLVWTPAYVLSETLFSAVALASALVLQGAVDRAEAARSSRHGGALALLAGGLVGVAALIRPAMLLFLPLALVWLLIRKRAVLAIALIAAAAAVIAPWTLRNIRAHGRVVLIASEGGVTFWTGNHPLARGEGDLAANPELKSADLAFRRAHPNLTAEELEPLYYRDALAWIFENPSAWAALVARKALYTVVPMGPSYALHSARYRVASVASYLVVLPFAIVGASRLRRSRRRPVALFLLAGSAVLVCLLFFPQERFRIPIIDPVLIVCAAALAGRPQS